MFSVTLFYNAPIIIENRKVTSVLNGFIFFQKSIISKLPTLLPVDKMGILRWANDYKQLSINFSFLLHLRNNFIVWFKTTINKLLNIDLIYSCISLSQRWTGGNEYFKSFTNLSLQCVILQATTPPLLQCLQTKSDTSNWRGATPFRTQITTHLVKTFVHV